MPVTAVVFRVTGPNWRSDDWALLTAIDSFREMSGAPVVGGSAAADLSHRPAWCRPGTTAAASRTEDGARVRGVLAPPVHLRAAKIDVHRGGTGHRRHPPSRSSGPSPWARGPPGGPGRPRPAVRGT